MENLLIDIALDTVHDFRLDTLRPIFELDTSLRETTLKNMYSEHLSKYLPNMEEMLTENGGYFALGRVSL